MLKGQIRRKVFAAGLALTMVFGGSSVLPFSQMFNDSIVCASADEITYTASFSCGSKSYNYTKPTGSNYTFLLSDVLTALDIEGEVTNVTVTENNSLFVEKKNGVWYLTMSNIWFSGKLTVTLGDTVKEITASVSQDRIPLAFVGWLKFNADGGTGTLTTEDNGTTYTNKMCCITGFHYTIPECPYVRDGFEFAGWDINGVTYQPGDNYIHNETTTAKALWRENESGTIINQSDLASLSVAEDLQHGTFDLPDKVRVGQKVHLVPAPDEGYDIYSVSVNGNTISSEKYQYYYTMTETPAVVSGEFKKALAGGTENSPALLNDNEVYFLTGGWYKVSGNITFNHEIIFTDDVHIVLEDGCQMIVIPNSAAQSITAIRGKNDSDLYIHGGSTGKLIVQYVSNLSSSIATHDFYVLGGDVNVIGVNSDSAVYATGDVYISGGNISAPYKKITAHEGNVYVSGGTVTGTLTTLNYNTVYVSGGKISGTLKSRYVNITGGQVDAEINCEYGLVLGCNSADDYINIKSIGFSDTRAVTNIAPGVILKDKEGNEYQDSLTLDEAKALNGKKLIYYCENNVDFNVNVQAAYFGTITADKVTAQYGDKVSLTVTPKTGFNIKSVKYNDTEIIPDSEGNYSFNMPRGDAKVTAEFEKQKFTVTWKNWDGTVLETDENVEYGSAPFYDGEEPVKAGALFTGWNKEFSAVTDNVEYTAVFEADDTSAKLIEANTVSVRESVEFNFFADINESQRDGAYVVFSYNHYGETASVHVNIDPDSTYSGHYRFPCPLTASEMNIPVKAELYLADSSAPVSVFTRTIKDYAKSRLEKSTNENEKALISALLNYGGYTQEYLGEGYNLDAMAFDDDTKLDLSSVNVSSAVTFNRPTEQIYGLTYLGSSLLLRDKVACLYYFDVDNGHTIDDYIFKIDGQIATPKHNNIGYYVEGKFRKAYELDDAEKVTVTLKTDSSEVFDFDYSVLVYAKTVLMKDLNAEKKTNLARAMYNYYTAARDYVEQSI